MIKQGDMLEAINDCAKGGEHIKKGRKGLSLGDAHNGMVLVVSDRGNKCLMDANMFKVVVAAPPPKLSPFKKGAVLESNQDFYDYNLTTGEYVYYITRGTGYVALDDEHKGEVSILDNFSVLRNIPEGFFYARVQVTPPPPSPLTQPVTGITAAVFKTNDLMLAIMDYYNHPLGPKVITNGNKYFAKSDESNGKVWVIGDDTSFYIVDALMFRASPSLIPWHGTAWAGSGSAQIFGGGGGGGTGNVLTPIQTPAVGRFDHPVHQASGNKQAAKNKCCCGATSVGSAAHSNWCDLSGLK